MALGLGLAATGADAASGPTCVPATLNGSALEAGAVTVSPLPGSRDATPQTQVSFKGVPASELRVLSVLGSRTGRHSGRLLSYSRDDGASFVPSRPFAEGERVTVRARLVSAGLSRPLFDQFAVASQDLISSTPEPVSGGTPAQVQRFRSRPDLRPPLVTVTARSPAIAAGDEFVAPYTGPGQAGPMILDRDGGLVWFKGLPADVVATNFRVQEYDGRPVLSWWQGDVSVHGFGLGEDVIADSTYTDIAHVKAGNGDQADLHELQITPQGTALITAYHPIRCNVAAAGGPADGAVTDGVIQEIDIKSGLVMYEWTSLDHVALSESYEHAAGSSTGSPFDFFHINSINLDRDASLLISARNTWAVYDLDPRSGQIAWRLGGRNSSFTAGPGTRSAWQHDPRELPDGSISLFDNGASPTIHHESRGVVVRLDPENHSATLVRQISRSPALLAESQGNVQALSNGDWFLGWGQLPNFSEFGPAGQLLFDAHFPVHTQSYRSFRFAWTGTPSHPPKLVVAPPLAGGAETVYASWNGATLVSSWTVLAGASPAQLQPVAQAPRSGFETALALPAATPGPYVAVQALDAAGHVLGVSAALAGLR
jgi:arylsulfotransferase ASST